MKSFETKFPKGIGQRLVIGVFLISIAVVALTATTTTWLEYRRAIREVDQDIDEIQRTYAKAIANSLWIFDRQQLMTQLEGLLNIPFINYLAVIGPEKTLAEVGSFRKSSVTSKNIPLTYSYKERSVPLGTLYVQADISPVLDRVLHDVFAVLICQGVLIIAMALSSSLLFRSLALRHVSAAAEFFRSFDITAVSPPLSLQKRRYGDELDALQDTFNEMCEKLHKTYGELVLTKRQIQDSEERFRAVFENAAVGIELRDREGRLVHVNSALCTMLGYSANELQGLDYVRGSHFDDLAASQEHVEALPKGVPGSDRMEKRYLRKDGTTMWADLSISMVRDSEGHHRSTVGVISDITERKRAEEALRESEAKYRNLFNNAEIGMFRTRLDGSEILDMNEKFLKIFGRTREVMRGKPSVIHWADPHERQEMLRRLNTDDRVTDFECKMLNDQDEVRTCITSLRVYPEQRVLEGSIMDVTERKLAEESLRAASDYNRRLIDASLDPLVTISAEGKINDVNTATEEVTGYSRNELIGTDFADYFTDSEKARAGYQEAFKVGSVSDYELQIRHRRGGLTSVMYNASVYYDHLGKVAGLFAAARNITKQKRAEQALRDSEEQYRAVFNNAGIGIKLVNRYKRIERVNPALLNMLGYSEAELLQLTSLEITHPDDREISNQHLAAILGDGPDSLRLEKRYIRKDGSVIWGDISISAIRDAHGNKNTVLEVVADITDRIEPQIALQDSEKRMRRIIDSSPVGIRITHYGRHVYANRALARMFGYQSQDEVLGLPAEGLFAPESRALIRQRVADRMAGKTIPPHYEASGMTRQGKTIALETWGTEIAYLGKKSWLAFITDISEAKSLRAQLLQAQKMEAVGTLAGGIAHDFNNILQVVLGFSEMILMEKVKGDPEYEDLEKIRSAARKGGDLVKGLLAFSRKGEIHPRPLNPNQVIQQVEAILGRTLPKTIKVDLMLQERLSAISADPVQIEQILLNLAVNARDAMPEGGTLFFQTSNVSLDESYCREHLGAEPGDYVLLTVSDTGEGMSKQTLEHIFEPFFSTKPPGEGTGLGLAMVYGIVKQHSGDITCYSEPGAGTTFKLYFPVIEMKNETRVREEVVRFPGGTETILIADDEDLVRELAKRILSRAGYTVLTATNGREALQSYKKKGHTIALIVLDLVMPEMDGNQCLRELLKINPRARVLVASGYSAGGLTKGALEGGARGFVSKPFDMGQLLQTVRKILDDA
jgi:two-component system, cell cycle sensor histidine kinase and response regulator CckA